MQDTSVKTLFGKNIMFKKIYDGVYSFEKIVNISAYMHPKRMILYSFERGELALS